MCCLALVGLGLYSELGWIVRVSVRVVVMVSDSDSDSVSVRVRVRVSEEIRVYFALVGLDRYLSSSPSLLSVSTYIMPPSPVSPPS